MKCNNCRGEMGSKDKYCPHCGEKKASAFKFLFPPIFFGLLLTGSAFAIVLMPLLLFPIVFVGAVYAGFLFTKIKNAIGYVPDKDNIKKCNRCGSTDIKLYRKGYDYKVGFWGAIFGVRGSGYAGGFDANKTCCRCMDCGKDWETDYDYRLINK